MKLDYSAWRRRLPPLLALTVLGIYDLGRAPLSISEQTYIQAAQAPVATLLHALYSPLYLLFLHAWSTLGQSAPGVRLSSLAIGLLALIIAARLVRGLGGANAERGALLLLAFSPFLLPQVRTVSAAPLALLVAVVGFICFLEFLRAGQRQWLAAWLGTALVALLVHGGLYYMVLVQCLGMLFYWERLHNRQRDWWLAQLLPLAFFLWRFNAPLSDYFQNRLDTVFTSATALLGTGASILSRLLLATAPTSALGIVGGILFLLLLAPGLWTCRDFKRDPRHGLLLLGTFVPCLLYLLAPNSTSYLLAALPFLLTLVAMGIRLYPQWGRQLLWSGITLCLLFSHHRFFF